MLEQADIFEIIEQLELAAQKNLLTDKQLHETREILKEMGAVGMSDHEQVTGLYIANQEIQQLHMNGRRQWVLIEKQPLHTLSNISDLLPSPALRKRLKKMMADQAVHIDDLQRAGRFKAARWNAWCTWALWFWYVLKSPLSSLLSVAKRSIS